MRHTIRQDLSGRHGQAALVEVLGLLCRLGDEDRLELVHCGDPAAVVRMAEYVGCRHDSRLDGESLKLSLRLGHYHNLIEY